MENQRPKADSNREYERTKCMRSRRDSYTFDVCHKTWAIFGFVHEGKHMRCLFMMEQIEQMNKQALRLPSIKFFLKVLVLWYAVWNSFHLFRRSFVKSLLHNTVNNGLIWSHWPGVLLYLFLGSIDRLSILFHLWWWVGEWFDELFSNTKS